MTPMSPVKIIVPASVQIKVRTGDGPVKVTASPASIPGPPGADGEGQGGASYVHTQSSASMTWTINHNLGFWPTIVLFTTGGVEFDAAIVHTSLNQAVVSIAMPIAGIARCS